MRLPQLASLGESLQQLQQINVEQALNHVAASTIKMVTPTLQKRATSTCSAGDTSSACKTPQDNINTQTLAIALGTAIPLGSAIIVLIYLHRRHMKKQRLEDLNDPHRSLDFGTDPQFSTMLRNKSEPEMSAKRHRGQLSMDLGMGSPYLLPEALHGSRASLRSMSRSVNDDNDPYRPVTLVKKDWESMRGPRMPGDTGSVYSAAGSIQSTRENASLVANARPMSQTFPARNTSVPVTEARAVESADRKPLHGRKESAGTHGKPLPMPVLEKDNQFTPLPMPVSEKDSFAPLPMLSPVNLDDFIPPPPPPPPKEDEAAARPPRSSSVSAGSASLPPRKSSMAKLPAPIITEPFPDAFKAEPPRLPEIHTTFEDDGFDISSYANHDNHISADMLAQPQPQSNRYSIMGLRPLPSDLPEDNPEQRANRIRSFYKEYFDDSKPIPKGAFVDDYDAGYLADYGVYDHTTGAMMSGQREFAQPIGRRAMTPPPRGANGYGPGPERRRHMSTQSAAARGPRGRAQSAPRKRLPPPSALTSVPTPYMLKDDASIFNAIDFAPPVTYRDRQAGRRPDSPLGVSRPYSPIVAAHSPLVASYDELASVPSPHLLRKSGTFTGLDFAPPPRFRDNGSASDAGSIRSNRSGISNMQQRAIREGAYRVSRIPTEMVGSREDLANQLKPRWEMRNGSNVMG